MAWLYLCQSLCSRHNRVAGEGGETKFFSDPLKHAQDSLCPVGTEPCWGWLLGEGRRSQSGRCWANISSTYSTYKPGQRVPLGTTNVCELCCSKSSKWIEANKFMFSILCLWTTSLFTHILLQGVASMPWNPRAQAISPWQRLLDLAKPSISTEITNGDYGPQLALEPAPT